MIRSVNISTKLPRNDKAMCIGLKNPKCSKTNNFRFYNLQAKRRNQARMSSTYFKTPRLVCCRIS